MTAIASGPVTRTGSSGMCTLWAGMSRGANVSTCVGTIVVFHSIR